MYFDKLLAAAILISNVEIESTNLTPLLIQRAIEKEIVTSSETRVYFMNEEDFAGDLSYLRLYLNELSDAPMIYEVNRFPMISDLLKARDMNRDYQTYLKNQLVIEGYNSPRYNLYSELLAETETLYKAWDYAYTAAQTNYYLATRKKALQDLRSLIGYEDFYKGNLPPYLPLWRFWEIEN